MERPKKTQLAPLPNLNVVPLHREKKHRQGQRLKTGPYTTEALPVSSSSNHVLPLGGVSGGFYIMPKAYKVTKRTVMFDKENPKTVYSVSPVSYGILTSEDVANQIAAESSATPGDVKNVLDRYAYYVKENLKKGYSIQLLGFGNLTIRFITAGTAKTEKEANAKLIQGLVPSFTPSFKIINSKRIYDLLPDKITLVKYNGTIPADSVVDTTDPGSGSDSSSGSGSDTTDPGSSEDGGGYYE